MKLSGADRDRWRKLKQISKLTVVRNKYKVQYAGETNLNLISWLLNGIVRLVKTFMKTIMKPGIAQIGVRFSNIKSNQNQCNPFLPWSFFK